MQIGIKGYREYAKKLRLETYHQKWYTYFIDSKNFTYFSTKFNLNINSNITLKTKVSKTFKYKNSHHFYLLKNVIKVICTFADLLFFFFFWSSSIHIYIYIISTTCILSLFGSIFSFRWCTITTMYTVIDR